MSSQKNNEEKFFMARRRMLLWPSSVVTAERIRAAELRRGAFLTIQRQHV